MPRENRYNLFIEKLFLRSSLIGSQFHLDTLAIKPGLEIFSHLFLAKFAPINRDQMISTQPRPSLAQLIAQAKPVSWIPRRRPPPDRPAAVQLSIQINLGVTGRVPGENNVR